MSTATALLSFAQQTTNSLANGANGTSGNDFSPPRTTIPGASVAIFVITNEEATEILHETTDYEAHNRQKLQLRCQGTIFHHGQARGATKRAAKTNILNAMAVLAATIAA